MVNPKPESFEPIHDSICRLRWNDDIITVNSDLFRKLLQLVFRRAPTRLVDHRCNCYREEHHGFDGKTQSASHRGELP
jgi:hypothetical protein